MQATNPTRFAHAEKLRDCVHCGLCLSACPTYLELGMEADSPRGRIYLMNALHEGAIGLDDEVVEHLDRCLGCRACETACPSGVRYGLLIEDARAVVRAGARRPLRTRLIEQGIGALFPRMRLFARLLAPARWLERTGLLAWLRRHSRIVRLLPTLETDVPVVPRRLAAQGAVRAQAALFEGCVARVMFAGVNAATVQVLAANGCEVESPSTQGCCGALRLHAGDREGAKALARANIDAFAATPGAIVSNAAGCGALLREYDELLHDDPVYAAPARAFAARVRDVSGMLEEIGFVAPLGELPLRVTYHDACHLAHGMGVRQAPRALLRRIPGIELVELEEADVCCGSAGSYNLTQPEMAVRLGRRKAERIRATGATVVAAGNPGCTLQIRAALAEAGVATEVVHPVELIARALRAAGAEKGKTPG
jgi:glycolate oxidase iron-sulfur subunit